jgi:pimeloyl-ACP methyl ester carboxylesterase
VNVGRARANGIEIEYETLGTKADQTILLIMGLGGQLIHWPDAFCTGLVERGFHVVRFDNRDSGLSTSFASWGKPDLVKVVTQVMMGQKADVPYRLDDMANDAVGLLDALGIERAHIAGASMGGSIAQIVAGHYPVRTRSLISIMSTTGRPELATGERETIKVLLEPPPPVTNREALIRHGMRVRRAIGSPGYPQSDDELRAIVTRSIDRKYDPDGSSRQYIATIASGHRVELLQKLKVPTLVLHGEADPLLPQEHGRDTAWITPGAQIDVYPGWGHDLPPGMIPILVDRIATFCKAQT